MRALSNALAVDYLRQAEGLKVLAMPPGGSNTRWPYWVDCADWFAPATVRYENLLAYLLHTWLVAQGDAGIGLTSPPAIGMSSSLAERPQASSSSSVSSPSISGEALVAKIKLVKDDARRELLEEMCDPAVRIWLIFLTIYGRMSEMNCSMKRFLNYTQNDNAARDRVQGATCGEISLRVPGCARGERQ